MNIREVCEVSTAKCIGGIINCGVGIALFANYIVGMVWRFSQSGQYAAGDLIEGEALYSDDSIELIQW